MEENQPAVQYFALLRSGGGTPENAKGLVRRTHTRPAVTDEALGSDLEWHPTDYLYRYYMLGSTDFNHAEISAEFAERLMERWRGQRRRTAAAPQDGAGGAAGSGAVSA
jgi:hypothetical protein